MKNLKNTALVLIGYQNDYFSKDGILHSVIEESSRVTGVLANTLTLLREHGKDFGMVVNTPIHFTHDYSELNEPIGILRTIKDVGAFKENTHGAEVIRELAEFASFIHQIPGKRGLNAFTKTNLHSLLQDAGITDIIFAGTVTSLCIDSSARSAVDLEYNVSILSDCTSSRTPFEQEFYCTEVFPLYAKVYESNELLIA